MMVALIPAGALLVGLTLGWLIGRHQGKRELERFREGLNLRENFCWIRSQVPRDPES